MKVNRTDFLRKLVACSAGTTTREVLEQSHTFTFTGKYLVTFNGEVLTKTKSPIPDLIGAVPAQELLAFLTRFPDEEVDVHTKENQLVLKAGRKAAGITMERNLSLPWESAPKPGDWAPAPTRLLQRMVSAAQVCGQDETQPRTTEVHVASDRVEACDNHRLYRCMIETGLEDDCLVPALSVKSLQAALSGRSTPTAGSNRWTLSRNPEEIDVEDSNGLIRSMSVTKGWMHLRTKDTTYSLRMSQAEYPDLDALLKIKNARRMKLPKDLAEAISRAKVMFLGESFDAYITVTLSEGRLTLESSKEEGWYRESAPLKYQDEPLKFQIHPMFLEDVLARSRKVVIGNDRIRLTNDDVTFVVSLEIV